MTTTSAPAPLPLLPRRPPRPSSRQRTRTYHVVCGEEALREFVSADQAPAVCGGRCGHDQLEWVEFHKEQTVPPAPDSSQSHPELIAVAVTKQDNWNDTYMPDNIEQTSELVIVVGVTLPVITVFIGMLVVCWWIYFRTKNNYDLEMTPRTVVPKSTSDTSCQTEAQPGGSSTIWSFVRQAQFQLPSAKNLEAPKTERDPWRETQTSAKNLDAPKTERDPSRETQTSAKNLEAPKTERDPLRETQTSAKNLEAPKTEWDPLREILIL